MALKDLTIEGQGGIDQKLENERAIHNGFGWREFDTFARLHQAGRLSLAALAALMNMKSIKTMQVWLEHRRNKK